jgi:tetratricopeptide (TPR) repeat protein
MADRSFLSTAPRQWRSEPRDEPFWAHERRHRFIKLGAWAVVVVVVITAGLGALVWQARQNYLAGERALAVGAYGTAIDRLNAAKVAGFAYADSDALLTRAVTLSQQAADNAAVLRGGVQPTAATRRVDRAAGLFAAGHYAQALALIPAGFSARFPPAVLGLRTTAQGAPLVSLLLLVRAQSAFAAGAWQVARADAQGVLARDSACTPAADLAARAERRALAQPYVARAKALASSGNWRAASSAVHRALRIDPTYPGAAALLARITATIAQKKAAAAATSAPAPTTPTPPAPAPTPAPQPPPPPPPP